MRGASRGVKAHAQHAAGRDAKPVVSRLAVDEIPYPLRRLVVGDTRAVAATLFAGEEQHRNPGLTRGAKPFDRCYLGRENPFRVARPAAEDHATLLPRSYERRYAVEMRGEDNLRCGVQLREHIETTVRNPLFGDAVPAVAQKTRQPGRYFNLASRGGIDVDECSSKPFDVARGNRPDSAHTVLWAAFS